VFLAVKLLTWALHRNYVPPLKYSWETVAATQHIIEHGQWVSSVSLQILVGTFFAPTNCPITVVSWCLSLTKLYACQEVNLQEPRTRWSLDSAVGIATGYVLGDRGEGVRVPVGARFFPLHIVWGLSRLLSNGYRKLFRRGVKLTTHLQLALQSRPKVS
jgi:hypothetical protein